jgi:chaperonin GroES
VAKKILEANWGKVLLPAYGGNNLKIGEEEYTLFKSSEILAIINE